MKRGVTRKYFRQAKLFFQVQDITKGKKWIFTELGRRDMPNFLSRCLFLLRILKKMLNKIYELQSKCK